MSTAAYAEVLAIPALAGPGGAGRIEVRIFWNGQCRDVVERDARDNATAFTVGEAPECDAHLPAEAIGGASSLALVAIEDGCARIARLGTVSLESLRHSSAVVSFGALTFEIRAVDRCAAFHAPLDMNWRSQSAWAVSLALHLVFFGLIALVPPEAAGFSFDEVLRSNRYAAVMIAPPEAPTLRPQDQQQVGPDDGGEVAPRMRGVEGQAGDRTSQKSTNRYALQQVDASRPVALGREVLREMVTRGGILPMLSAAPSMTSPFGAAIANGRDPENALGALIGDRIGPNFGFDGLGVRGTGRHGGGDCPDCLGLVGSGNDTIGNALQKGPNGQPGYDGPRLGPRSTGPRIGFKSEATVKGTLARELIARVVRRHKPQIEHCYEKGLARNSALSGRIAIRFQIGLGGGVDKAVVAESSLGDAQTEQCIAAVFARMDFPRTDGVVFVTYPFSLSSAGS